MKREKEKRKKEEKKENRKTFHVEQKKGKQRK